MIEAATGIIPYNIRIRVRFDYRGEARPPRFIFGGTAAEIVAKEQREQSACWWRNVPHPGLKIESVDEGEIYILQVEGEPEPVAFAPLEVSLSAYNPEDILPLLRTSSFRCLEILAPASFELSHREMERLLCLFAS